jgi:acyl carrier protein
MPQHISQGDEVPPQPLAKRMQEWLAQRLPYYMVPNQYVPLAKLPLTASGKVDRKALPLPDRGHQKADAVQPETELEKQLLALVRECFKIESLGLEDNFFALGANSLDMVQLFNVVQRELQCRVTVGDIFANSTVKKLAALLSRQPMMERGEDSAEKSVDLDPEQIDRLAANLDNLSDEEVERLLRELDS